MMMLKKLISSAYSISSHAVHFFAPVIVASLIQTSNLDERIRRIVIGGSLIYSGYYLTRKTLFSKKFSCLALPGIGISLLGVLTIATGLLGLRSLSCEEKVQKAMENLFKCPDVKHLWNTVNKDGKASIYCCVEAEKGDQSFEHPASIAVEYFSSSILVPDELMGKMEPRLLYALTDLKNREIMPEIIATACDQNNVFFMNMQAMKYKTIDDTNAIAQQCIEGKFWSKEDFEIYGKLAAEWDFKAYLNDPKGGIKDYHAQQIQRDLYCHAGKPIQNQPSDFLPLNRFQQLVKVYPHPTGVGNA